MARPLRIEYPGAVYHVTSRGNERRPIFRSDRDRRTFLLFLSMAVKRFGWSVSAWVLMTNHFHLVIQTPEPNLSRGMQWLNGAYAGWFNHAHDRSGHLFQGRYHAFLIEKEAYFAEVLRYVVLNPVRANMVGRPEMYRWSSYRATAGKELSPDWFDVASALIPFGPELTEAHSNYLSFVDAAVSSPVRLWDKVTHAIYLGTQNWTMKMRAVVESRVRSTDHPAAQRAVGRPRMAAVVQAVARVSKIHVDVVRCVRGGASRRLAAWLGWHEGLLTLRSIAASLRLRSEGYVSTLIRRCDRELGTHPTLLAQMDASLALLR